MNTDAFSLAIASGSLVAVFMAYGCIVPAVEACMKLFGWVMWQSVDLGD